MWPVWKEWLKILRDSKIDTHSELRKREVFYVADFANLLGVKSDTVNKNYAREGANRSELERRGKNYIFKGIVLALPR